MSTEAFLPAENARHFSEVGELFFHFSGGDFIPSNIFPPSGSKSFQRLGS